MERPTIHRQDGFDRPFGRYAGRFLVAEEIHIVCKVNAARWPIHFRNGNAGGSVRKDRGLSRSCWRPAGSKWLWRTVRRNLGNQTVQDRLVQRFDLKRVYWDRLDEDARKDLAERTGVAEDRKSGIITISVADRDAHRATALAQAYVEELNRLSAELSTSAAHRERVFLEERLQAVKVDLDQAAVDFSQFSSKNTAIDLKEQARAMVEAAAQLQGELIAAESEQKRARSNLLLQQHSRESRRGTYR